MTPTHLATAQTVPAVSPAPPVSPAPAPGTASAGSRPIVGTVPSALPPETLRLRAMDGGTRRSPSGWEAVRSPAAAQPTSAPTPPDGSTPAGDHAPTSDGTGGRGRTGSGDGPDRARGAARERRREEERHIRALAGIVAQACVEAECGLRPARQLAAWLDLPTYEKMVRRSVLAAQARSAAAPALIPRALNARCSQTAEGIYEASATVMVTGRVRAMALRIERHRQRWRVTALELG